MSRRTTAGTVISRKSAVLRAAVAAGKKALKKKNAPARAKDGHGVIRSETLLQNVMNQVNDGVTVQSKEGKLLYANEQAARLIGFSSPEELMQAPIAEFMKRFTIYGEDGSPASLATLPGRQVITTGKAAPAKILRFRVNESGEDRWSSVNATPLTDESGELVGAINVFHDITEHKRAEERNTFIAEASALLSSSLDYPTILDYIGKLIVPRLADWFSVSLPNEEGRLQNAVVTHSDPEKVEWAKKLNKQRPTDMSAPTGAPAVFRTGKSELYPFIPEELLAKAIKNEEDRQILEKLGLTSIITVPVVSRGKTIGVLSMVYAESSRHYDANDLAFAEDIGRRIGSAIENSRLYAEAQKEIDVRKRSEESLKQLAQAIPQIVWINGADPLKGPEFVNRQWEEYAGGSAEALREAGIEYMTTEDRGEVLRRWEESMRTGNTFEMQYRLRRKDGMYRWFLARSVPVRDEKGAVIKWFGTATDIHDQMATSETLRESEERFRSMADSVSALVWVSDLDMKRTYFNKSWMEFTGSQIEEEIGDGWQKHIHAEDTERYLSYYRAAFKARKPFEVEYRLRRHDGQYRWVLARGNPRFTHSGEFAGFVGLCLDVTERKLAEDQITQLNLKLEQRVQDRTQQLVAEIEERKRVEAQDRANLERLHNIIETMPLGVIVYDENQRVLHANEKVCDMFGLSLPPSGMINHTVDEITTMLGHTVHAPGMLKDSVNAAVESGQPQSDHEMFLLGGRVISSDYIPVFSEGVSRGHVFLYRDITREKRADATKSEFMSLASHQLRTPLTAIRWTFGRLQRQMANQPGAAAELRLMEEGRKATARMSETIDTMLKISKLQSGDIKPNRADIRLGEYLQEVTAPYIRQSRQKDQHLIIECAPTLMLHNDPKLLKEVIINLVSNAVKYTPQHGEIRVTAKADSSGAIHIAVKDTGYGIPQYQQAKVFSKFFRGDNVVSRETEGTGLGLYLVSLIGQLIDCRISFASTEGRGTTFTLVFVALAAPDQA